MECLAHNCHALVLAGGSGTRLWPLSRALFPKQLLAFESDKSLLQLSLQRLLGLFAPECIHIVTNEDHVFEVRNQAAVIAPEIKVIAEPKGRNTLPAILLGLDEVLKQNHGQESLIGVFPSDHYILNEAGFQERVAQGFALADQGYMVTFGVPPTSPETGYGYIKRGTHISGDQYEIECFVEKPDRQTAESFLRSGTHFWNSGIFIYNSSRLLEEVQKQQPSLNSWWQERVRMPLASAYGSIPSISVDYGIMEKAERIAMVEADFGWDDLGSWEALYRLAKKDEQNCAVQGDVLALDCKDSLLISRWGKLVTVGLSNVVAVQTRDATLVCARDQVQKVKDVVEELKKAGSPLANVHLTVRRPWGTYTVLEEGSDYKIKRITVNAGGTLSLQMHHHRSEHWVVVQGVATVRLDENEIKLTEREWVSIPQGAKHRLHNHGIIPLELIEIQSGAYLEEDDIVRFEDVYGRK